MDKLVINLVTRSYDHLMPLACGDVVAEGIDLRLDRQTAIGQFMVDLSYQAGELSFSQYLIRTSQGDRRFVGLPVFLMRGYRHRCFYVLRGEGPKSLKDLAGGRVGIEGWPDTGNTWSRAAIREQGVGIDEIDWWLGPVDDTTVDHIGQRPQLALPPNVRPVAGGRTLQDMLLGGELEAIMCPWPPNAFHWTPSPIARLFPNYRQVEQDYARRVGFYPAFHILAIQRPVFERDPWLARSLYNAFDRARVQSQENRRFLGDVAPWLLADLDESIELLGADWQAYGVEANQEMIQALCDEELAQGLIAQPLDAGGVFAEFEQAMEQQ